MNFSFLLRLMMILLCSQSFMSHSIASVNLKSVQITDGSQVELLFDGKVDPNLVKTEFVREHIQLSLLKTSVYPAKVNFVQGKELTKVFAYQYAPELVRCRLTMNGDAARFQNRIQMKANGKVLILKILADETKVTQEKTAEKNKESSIQMISSSSLRSGDVKSQNAPKNELSQEEAKLVEKVINSNEKNESKEPVALTGRGTSLGKSNAPLTSGKNPPSSFRFIGVVLFVFGILGLFLFFLKKVKEGDISGGKNKGLKNFLGKLGGQVGSKKVIQVVSTLSLGPKKSITVVQIQNRMLVLGMSNDSVNLITEFKADDEEFDLSDTMNLKDFATGIKSLENEDVQLKRPQPMTAQPSLQKMNPVSSHSLQSSPSIASKMNRTSQMVSQYGKNPQSSREEEHLNEGPAFNEILKEESTKNSIRAQVKSRLEGLKPL